MILHFLQVFVACITKDYLGSVECIDEMILARKREKVIIPLLLEAIKPWPPEGSELAVPLAGVTYINATKSPDKGYGELLSQIQKFTN